MVVPHHLIHLDCVGEFPGRPWSDGPPPRRSAGQHAGMPSAHVLRSGLVNSFPSGIQRVTTSDRQRTTNAAR